MMSRLSYENLHAFSYHDQNEGP
jgi:hypothetical protein